MFIFCKVKEKGKQCLIQSWAHPTPLSQQYMCSVHGLVDADGNKLKEINWCNGCDAKEDCDQTNIQREYCIEQGIRRENNGNL